ncbi:MAG TPA: hypothetical protein VM049_09030 [Gaiellaceae bacterium]|nr:hypothetical protein [Gaiellaceae bacterium]
MTPVTRHQPYRRALRAILVLAGFAALVTVTAPAALAAPSCGRQVIDDWYDNGRVDGTYKLHCYDDAIEILPRDVRDYSSAKEDIQRALQNKLRNQPPPPARTDPSPDETSTDPAKTTSASPTSPDDDPPSAGPTAGPEVSPPAVGGGESASSVPVPLLILAGLALLLVAGGSAGYLVRRLQSRRLPPPAV